MSLLLPCFYLDRRISLQNLLTDMNDIVETVDNLHQKYTRKTDLFCIYLKCGRAYIELIISNLV